MTDQAVNDQLVSDPKVLHPAEIELFDRGTGVKTIPLVGKWNTQGNKVTTGITIFGPGTAIALHTHNVEETVMVLEGEATLLTNAGERVLGPGMAAGFPAGKSDGHCLVNRGSRDVVYLEVGDRRPGDEVAYPDDDLAALWRDGRRVFAHSDGTPY